MTRPRFPSEYDRILSGDVLALYGSMSLEILIGRGLAMCAHPTAAWRVLSPVRRTLLVGAYFGASYVTVLASLLLLQK